MEEFREGISRAGYPGTESMEKRQKEWLMIGTSRRNRYRGRALGIALGIMIVAFLLVGFAAARPAGTEIYRGREVAPNEVIVKFRGAAPQMMGQAAMGENADETEHVGRIQAVRLHSRSKDVETLIRELSARSDVEYVEPNYVVRAVLTPNDPSFPNLWGMQAIIAPQAWDITTGSSTGPMVAVVDTGIDYTHADLAGNVWSAPADFNVTINGVKITCLKGTHGFNAITHTCNPLDDNNHGTHVSGTIGAVGNNGIGVVGVNWYTRIMGAKFLDSKGSGYLSDAIEAIDFVIQAKQAFGDQTNVRALSNSWAGGGFSQALLEEINLANTNGMLFVAAAGNSASNNDATPTYPASYGAPNVVAVAAIDSNNNLASFSNWGPTSVDLAAPGVNVLSTVRGGGYASYSGTSMATPHVSGAASLILSVCTLDTAGLKANILANVDPFPSLAGKTLTGGRLNVFKAIQACKAPTTPDFSLSAAPGSLTIIQGSTGTSTIMVTALNSFTGPVGLTVSGAPSGMTAGLSPTEVINSGTSTLTVDAGTAAAGTYTLTISGTSGGLTHSTSVVVTVTAPDFSISASPSSRTVNRGSSTTYTVTIARLNGFQGPVALSVSGLPSGGTMGTFSPNPITYSGTSSTLTVKTASSTPTGTYTLTIPGTSGSLSHKTSVTLQVRRNGFFG